MERVNQLERDVKALKSKVAKIQKQSNNGATVESSQSAQSDSSAPSTSSEVPADETREKTGGIGQFLDNFFDSKGPKEKVNEMRDMADSLNQGQGGGGARRKRKSRRNKKSRKNKRTGKRGGAKKNMRKNKKNKTRRNKNQRQRNSRRQQHGGS